MDAVFLIGRILFSLVFIASGVMAHFVQRKETAAFARTYNAPAPETMVPLGGVMIVLGGLSVMFGLWADVGAILLVLFLVPTTFIMHAFWKEQDPQAEQMQIAMFMKEHRTHRRRPDHPVPVRRLRGRRSGVAYRAAVLRLGGMGEND